MQHGLNVNFVSHDHVPLNPTLEFSAVVPIFLPVFPLHSLEDSLSLLDFLLDLRCNVGQMEFGADSLCGMKSCVQLQVQFLISDQFDRNDRVAFGIVV